MRPYHGHHGRNGPGQREYCNYNYGRQNVGKSCSTPGYYRPSFYRTRLTRKFVYEVKRFIKDISRERELKRFVLYIYKLFFLKTTQTIPKSLEKC